MLFNDPEHCRKGAVVGVQVFLETVLEVIGHAQKDLRSPRDICYAFHRRGSSCLILCGYLILQDLPRHFYKINLPLIFARASNKK